MPWQWNLLLRDYNEAKEYIEDIKDICDDFEGLCQRNLAANTGETYLIAFSYHVSWIFVCYWGQTNEDILELNKIK